MTQGFARVPLLYGGISTSLDEIADFAHEKYPPEESGGGVSLLTATRTLTVEEAQNLGSTAIELVAAPGAGKILAPVSVVTFIEFGTVPYPGDHYPTLYYGDDLQGILGIKLSLTATAFSISVPVSQTEISIAAAENQPLVIFDYFDPEAPYDPGDGIVTIVVSYLVVDVP